MCYTNSRLLQAVYTILKSNNLQYGPYAHFEYWTLVSDPWPNKVYLNIEIMSKQVEAKMDGVITNKSTKLKF